MSNRTSGVRQLVSDVLATMPQPYGEDITLEVCIAIEQRRAWQRRYDELVAELSHDVVNNWIGRYTKQLTGLRAIIQVDTDRSGIIGSYTKLRV